MNYQPAIALRELTTRQPKKVTVGETDVLLVRDGERVRAFQATCPHAGAPLEQGAVCGNQLVCPWHKAVFSLEDGHLCEPLALADLKQYPSRIENGMVLVRPEAMSVAAAAGKAQETPVYVILGGGAAGSAAIWTLRREGFTGQIVLIERETDAPYDRTALTKFVPSGKMGIDEVPHLLSEETLQQVRRITANVTGIDAKQQQIQLSSGEMQRFDRLLIAPGADPVRPDLPGHHLPGVNLLRSRQQAATLLDQVDRHQQLTIVGNGFIALEMASALRNRDIDVTIVARQPLPFAQQFGEEIGRYFRELHRASGVKFIEGEPAVLEGEERVTALRLKSGQRIAAQAVLLATGSQPATQFIHDLPQHDDGALLTDRQLKVSENIWAAGDIARYQTAEGAQRIEHFRVAEQQGRTAALNMLDRNITFDRVPFFWTTHFGTRYEYLGHAEQWDSYQLIGSLAEKRFIALYGQQDRLMAAFSCGMYTLTAALLLAMQQPMTMTEARNTVYQLQAGS